MSSGGWHDQLSELNGEQLYNLAAEMANARERAACAMALAEIDDERQPGLLGLYGELCEVFHDVGIQQARITVPLRQAQAIIWRAVFARNHPVPVSGT